MVQALKKAVGVEKFDKFAQSAPSLFTNICIVGAFLYYLDRTNEHEASRNSKADLIIQQRIEQCHAVQQESNEVMKGLSEALREQSVAFERLAVRLPLSH